MSEKYHFELHHDNVYGHTVSLLREYAPQDGIHLDLGCGFGAIAEPIRDAGGTYVGADLDGDGIADLAKRGFEAHTIDLNASDLRASLDRVIAGRRVSSLSILDTLEHVHDARRVLVVLQAIAVSVGAPLVVSVPNVAHRDLGIALMTGRWKYTQVGILDHTHMFHFSEGSLGEIMREVGFRQVAANDVTLLKSDQHHPMDHVAFNSSTWLGSYLRGLRDSVDGLGSTVQLVRAFLPTHPRPDASPFRDLVEEPQPFLSIVTRTQGRRIGALRDVLLCLSAQTCQDFEVLVLPHKVDADAQKAIERVVEDCPEFLRKKIRIERVDDGGRTRPLNVGFGIARGRYVSILDDDDVVFAHWVETFREMANAAPGTVLRAVAVEREIETSTSAATPGFVAVSGLKTTFPSKFDFFQHLRQNYSPPVGLAFPRSAYRDLQIRFDETLNTVEDWDYEMRAMSVCGFRDTPKITAIYHRWRTGESSYTVHPESEWKENYRQVVDNYDKVPRIFPAGTAAHIRRQAELIDELRGEIHRLTVPAEVRTPMFRLRKFGARWRRRTIAAWRRIFGGLRGH